MAQQTNFPVSNTPFVDATLDDGTKIDGRLTKEARTLLRTIWLSGPGAPQQTGWANSTTTSNQGPLADYAGGTTPANMAAQIALLTQVVGTLINALEARGILQD